MLKEEAHMLIDLTTKVTDQEIKDWLAKQEDLKVAMGHIGTHLDTYLKTDIPLEYLKCRGVLIDASAYAEQREITVKDIEQANIQAGDFVIFRTDRIKMGYGVPKYFEEHPQLSQELIQELCNKKVNFIGIDASGIRRADEHVVADKLCEEHGVYVIENLSHLDKITQEYFTVYTLWFDDTTATGLRCRVICEE